MRREIDIIGRKIRRKKRNLTAWFSYMIKRRQLLEKNFVLVTSPIFSSCMETGEPTLSGCFVWRGRESRTLQLLYSRTLVGVGGSANWLFAPSERKFWVSLGKFSYDISYIRNVFDQSENSCVCRSVLLVRGFERFSVLWAIMDCIWWC